jgi:hypothetical protein
MVYYSVGQRKAAGWSGSKWDSAHNSSINKLQGIALIFLYHNPFIYKRLEVWIKIFFQFLK